MRSQPEQIHWLTARCERCKWEGAPLLPTWELAHRRLGRCGSCSRWQLVLRVHVGSVEQFRAAARRFMAAAA